MPDLTHTIAFRAVFGAVHNALHGHPAWKVPKDFARSVAKRAAGTMLAHLKDGQSLLASARRSGQKGALLSRSLIGADGAFKAPAVLRLIQLYVGQQAGAAQKAGDHGRYIDLVTMARIAKRERDRWPDV